MICFYIRGGSDQSNPVIWATNNLRAATPFSAINMGYVPSYLLLPIKKASARFLCVTLEASAL